MKCDQDLFLNFWYDLKNLLLQDEFNPRVRCAFGNVLIQAPLSYILEATPSHGVDKRKALLLFLSHFKKNIFTL